MNFAASLSSTSPLLQVKIRLRTWLVEKDLLKSTVSDICHAPPLTLPAASQGESPQKKARVHSYKEMFNGGNCVRSLQRSKVYEAGGSILWMSPFPAPPEGKSQEYGSVIKPSDFTYSQMVEAQSLFQASDVYHDGRILYPNVIQCMVSVIDPLLGKVKDFPQSLSLISGHLPLYAWWLSVYEALQESADDRLLRLWQAGLTATIQIHLVDSDGQLARLCIASSEALRNLQASNDSLMAFCERLVVLTKSYKVQKQQDVLDRLKKDGVLFQGRAINKNVLVAAESIQRHMSPEARQTLVYLSSKYGTSVLTEQVGKLYKIILMISRLSSSRLPGENTANILSLVLSQIANALDLEILKTSQLTGEGLTGKEGKDAQNITNADDVPIVSLCLTQISVAFNANQSLGLLDDCPKSVKEALSRLLDPQKFRLELDLSFASVQSSGLDPPATTYDEASHMTLDRVKESLKDVTYTGQKANFDPLVDWAFSLADGQLMSSLRKLSLESDISKALVSGDLEVAKELREAMKVFEQVASDTPAPAMSWQQLMEIGHDTEQDADLRKMFKKQEREEVWSRASTVRKSLVSYSSLTNWKRSSLDAAYKASPCVSFTGEMNKKFMLFHLAADLCFEGEKGWSGPAKCKASPMLDLFKDKLAFVSEVSGNKMSLVFDGRIEDTTDSKETVELSITYSGKFHKTHSRRVFGSQKNHEIAVMILGPQRIRLQSQAREDPDDYRIQGEDSTAYTSYVKVPYPETEGLPRVPFKVKAKVLGLDLPRDEDKSPGSLNHRWPKDWSFGENVPMFWSETKCSGLYEAILDNYQIAMVCDLSPSSALMAACLSRNIRYHGLTLSDQHTEFLERLSDREAIRHICCKEHPLWQEDLAGLLNSHFPTEANPVSSGKNQANPATPPE
ncbi:unnamed protein product [Symbiodinium sp. CCMP2592]|nr:unnamed protein product [Symbiodinium sp. CCMP2592]